MVIQDISFAPADGDPAPPILEIRCRANPTVGRTAEALKRQT
jgi:hypothetical protein